LLFPFYTSDLDITQREVSEEFDRVVDSFLEAEDVGMHSSRFPAFR